jgi:3-deoxy-manno-octulosonate cytidylyltransferase (CMP-KDO synthetase)
MLRGKPLVVRVLERVTDLGVVDEIVVATDAEEVAAVVERSGGRAVLTSHTHESGTERIAEVIARAEFARFETILNVQGDEPFVTEGAVRGALDRVGGGDPIGTAAAALDPASIADPARVKVVSDVRGRAIYFSRAPIPYARDVVDGYTVWQHLGIYAYTRDALLRWVALPRCEIERVERLEQLRPLYHGMTIGVALVREPAAPGIDTPDDLVRAEAFWDDYATRER